MADGIPTSSASPGSKPASLLLAPAGTAPAKAASPPLASHFPPPSQEAPLAKEAKARPAKPPGEPHLPLLLPLSKPSDFSGSLWSRQPSCPRERGIGARHRSRPPPVTRSNWEGWNRTGVGLEELPQVTEGSPKLAFGSGWNPTPAPVPRELLLHTLPAQPPKPPTRPRSLLHAENQNKIIPPANGRQDTS